MLLALPHLCMFAIQIHQRFSRALHIENIRTLVGTGLQSARSKAQPKMFLVRPSKRIL